MTIAIALKYISDKMQILQANFQISQQLIRHFTLQVSRSTLEASQAVVLWTKISS